MHTVMRSPGRKPLITKKSANLSVDSELLHVDKTLKIGLSKTFLLEEGLGEPVREAHSRSWLEENHQAITEYNHRIEQRGVFGHGLRRF